MLAVRSRQNIFGENGKQVVETPWEHDYWTPEPWWSGEQVFVLASGPSLTQEVCDKIKGRNAIVINASFRLAPWARVWYFTDGHIYETFCDDVAAWPGEVVCMSKRAKQELNKQVKRIQVVPGEGDPTVANYCLQRFPPIGHPAIMQGRSSGHTAISLAIAMGAARVVMLGYDMRFVNGREHHHSEYHGPRDMQLYEREFVPTFNGWSAAAQRSGVEIVNCTPGSAVTEFPFRDLDEVMQCRS